MTRNPILEELYAARAELLADADGDIDRLLAGIRRREAESSHPMFRRPVPESPRTDASTGVADVDESTMGSHLAAGR